MPKTKAKTTEYDGFELMQVFKIAEIIANILQDVKIFKNKMRKKTIYNLIISSLCLKY